MEYAAWRITYQDSEQAARAAFLLVEKQHAEIERLKSERDEYARIGYSVGAADKRDTIREMKQEIERLREMVADVEVKRLVTAARFVGFCRDFPLPEAVIREDGQLREYTETEKSGMLEYRAGLAELLFFAATVAKIDTENCSEKVCIAGDNVMAELCAMLDGEAVAHAGGEG